MVTARKRIVLDTNLFYYSSGLEVDLRLRGDWADVLRERYSLSLSSPTLVEVLTRSDLGEAQLWSCLDHMFSGLFEDFVQIGYLPFDQVPVRLAAQARDAEALGSLREAALQLRIDCESEFLRFVAFVLIGGLFSVVIEAKHDRLDAEMAGRLNRQLNALLNGNVEMVRESMRSALVQGYAPGGKRDKIVEDRLQCLFSSFTHVAFVNLHLALHGGAFVGDLQASAPLTSRVMRDVESDEFYGQIKADQHPMSILRKQRHRGAVSNYIDKMREDFCANSLMPQGVLRFFVDHLLAGLQSGTKYRKNDAIDLVLAFSLTASNTLFVTNDERVIAALQTASPESYVASRSLRESS